jgi:hypothetical protein
MRLSKKSKVSYLLLDVVNAEEFLKVLNVPLTRDFIQILYQLQNSDIGSCEHFEENYP